MKSWALYIKLEEEHTSESRQKKINYRLEKKITPA